MSDTEVVLTNGHVWLPGTGSRLVSDDVTAGTSVRMNSQVYGAKSWWIIQWIMTLNVLRRQPKIFPGEIGPVSHLMSSQGNSVSVPEEQTSSK